MRKKERGKRRLARFFMGRYGNDTLGTVLVWSYAVLTLLMSFLSIFVDDPLFYVLYLIGSAALVWYILFRMLSRNIAKRRRENERFCSFFKLFKNRFRDRKTHVYRKCPTCSAMLRLPKRKGKHSVVCPRCGERFTVKG